MRAGPNARPTSGKKSSTSFGRSRCRRSACRGPTKAAYQSAALALETALDRAAAASPNPGQPSVHRLNRAEYTNAVRDLIALEIDGRSLLPPDDAAYGFDNIADNLTVSPRLMERYLVAARRIGRLAFGFPESDPAVHIYKIPKFYMQDERIEEDAPFGTRGGIAVSHYFPLDGEYTFQVKLERNHSEVLRGMTDKSQLEIRVDGQADEGVHRRRTRQAPSLLCYEHLPRESR